MNPKKIILFFFACTLFMLFSGIINAEEEPVNPDKMPWRTDLQVAFDEAKESGKPVVLNFTAPFNTG